MKGESRKERITGEMRWEKEQNTKEVKESTGRIEREERQKKNMKRKRKLERNNERNGERR